MHKTIGLLKLVDVLESLKTLTLMWWPCISPVQPYPRSGPWRSCPPHEYCVWQTPPRWCSCSPGWTHCGWSERAGYSCPHPSRRSEPLRMKRTRVREINRLYFMVLLNAIVYAIVPGDTHDRALLSRFHLCACRNRPPFTTQQQLDLNISHTKGVFPQSFGQWMKRARLKSNSLFHPHVMKYWERLCLQLTEAKNETYYWEITFTVTLPFR